MSGLPLWRERVTTLLRHGRGRVDEPFIEPAQRRRIAWEARVHIALYLGAAAASLALGTDALLWYWVVPALIAQPMLRIFLLAEHTGCPLVPDMLRNSRTTHTNALVRFLAWNMPYHSEHHTYAAVPFHALPALHERLKDRHRRAVPRIRPDHPGPSPPACARPQPGRLLPATRSFRQGSRCWWSESCRHPVDSRESRE